MIGPVLNGLKGRKSGSVPGFSYSDANKNSGIVWDEGTFKEYIKDPKAKIPETKMVFPGIKNEQGNRRFVELHRAVRTGWQEEMRNMTLDFRCLPNLSATVQVACRAG
jgi:hypothetical protein